MDAPPDLTPRREFAAFALTLAALVALFLHESLLLGRVLSPADVVYAQPGFRQLKPDGFVPAHRLLMDPVLQVEPWLEYTRVELRSGRVPLWNPLVGGGAPHLANGQSAVFDPFHLIAYLGELPVAHAWMAAGRLEFAGLGMFLLARAWGLPRLGRWFAGLAYPFCGFLVVWLLYPPTASAVWLPWMLWAATRLLDDVSRPRVAALAALTAGSLLGGHVQTTAHNLLAVAAFVAWRASRATPLSWKPPTASLGAIVLGVALAGVQLLPHAAYLRRSPVWADREREHSGASLAPRPLDAACAALPLIYGSQRRGHPNLARALGVHNLNESAGGFAGLATLLWLAPLAWRSRRERPLVPFLAGMAFLSAAVAFAVPPFVQLAHLLPVLRVMDHRRLVHLTAFALVLLAAHALDRPAPASTSRRFRLVAWLAGVVLLLGALGVPVVAGSLRERALAHYRETSDPSVAVSRAERQLADLTGFLPPYLLLAAAQCGAIGWLAGRGDRRPGSLAAGLVLLDLFAFGFGHNPAIDPADHRPRSPLIDHLGRVAPPPLRVLAIGETLPPNMLMRYGLADIRNYDSVETSANLRAFESLYEPDRERGAHTSRRQVTWEGVLRAREALRQAAVAAVVGDTPPPPGAFSRVDVIDGCWIARLETPPRIGVFASPGEIRIDDPPPPDQAIVLPVTYDPGWRAETESRGPAQVVDREGFLAVRTTAGESRITLRYDPPEFRIGLALSLVASAATLAWLTLGARRHRGGAPSDQGWDARADDGESPSRPLKEGTQATDGPLLLRPLRAAPRRRH